jgi:hypothetical protein
MGYKVYTVKDSLHNNISERTTKYTLMCHAPDDDPKQGSKHVEQCCPTYLYIGAHLTDGCGGAGAVWRFQ